MRGYEVSELMKKGTLFVEYNGLTYEVIARFRHKVWLKRNNEKKSLRFDKIRFKHLIEGESTFKMYNSNKLHNSELEKLWKRNIQ